jgi:sulfatase-modifying factor enzyme 1
MPRFYSGLLISLLLASAGNAAGMDWTLVGGPGNACDPQSGGCFGAVGYFYVVGTYEVTNAQYVDFLNAKAASDPLNLYDVSMGNVSFHGGITRSGSPGSYTYSAIVGRENMPVEFVSFYDALRFANWLNNGQGSGDTETGAYTLLGGTPTPSNGATITRNLGATVFLTNEDEWYKAAYYAGAGSYFDYPAGSDTQMSCATPTAAANTANCNNVVLDLTPRGSYPGSPSPSGTFDQGGNVWEWNEAVVGGSRGMRGGSFDFHPLNTAASARNSMSPEFGASYVGFRVAPEPAGSSLLIAGVLATFGLAGWRRSHPARSRRARRLSE